MEIIKLKEKGFNIVGNKEKTSNKQASNISSEKNAVPFEVVESYKNVRTNLVYILSKAKKKSVVFSSSVQAEGKSTTTVNVAIVFSQIGDKVLLLDADMRLPSIHKKMKLQNTTGLSSVLVGSDTFEDAVIHVNANLDVLCSGPIVQNSLELLSSERVKELISELESKYDYVIIDTPPIGVVADSLVLAQNTAGIVLIARDNVTRYDFIEKSIAQANLVNVNVLGVILNGIDHKNKKYSYRRYKYGYGYNKNYGRENKN